MAAVTSWNVYQEWCDLWKLWDQLQRNGVKYDGTIYTPEQGLKGEALLEEGVKDTYNFGPILIKDGQAQPAWSETAKYYPRTAVGMVKPGIYVLLVTDTGSYAGLNHWDLVNIFNSYGCQYAYNLDGGGSATLYYNGQVMNKLINNYERPCGDFLYFTNWCVDNEKHLRIMLFERR